MGVPSVGETPASHLIRSMGQQGLTQLALTTDTLCNSLIFCKIHGTVNQIPCTILLDTGSSISLISQELLDKAHLTPTSVPQPVNILTAACTDMVLCTSATIMLTIGAFSVQHEAYVAPHLVSPVILGTDFLSKHQVRLDYGKPAIAINGIAVFKSSPQKVSNTL